MNGQFCNETSSHDKADVKNKWRLVGCFCSNTVFNLIRKVLTDIELKILEKGFDFAPIQNKINEP